MAKQKKPKAEEKTQGPKAPEQLTKAEIIALADADYAMWKAWKLRDLLKFHTGPARNVRKPWARSIVRPFDVARRANAEAQ